MVRRNMKRITIFLMTALMFLSFLYMMNTAYAEETGASSHEELAAAVRSTEGEIHIVLQDSFTLESRGEEPQIIIGSGKRVILEASGSDIILSHGSGGAMFFIEDGAQLIIKGNEGSRITLRETVLSEEFAHSCIETEGYFEAQNVTFEGFYAEKGAAVSLNDRENSSQKTDFLANTCDFSGNHAMIGGAVYVGEGRKAEINASTFTSNTAEDGNDAYVAGQMTFGDNNIITAYGPLNYETETDGSFHYAGQICGTGAFEIEERTDISGVVSWSVDSAMPESVQVILLADGVKVSEKTVKPDTGGYWEFSFRNLPVKDSGREIEYDIGAYEIEGFRFSKRGEADVGFEILYAAVPEEAVLMTTEEMDEQLNSELSAGSLISEERETNAISVKKSPTDEKTEIGGQAIFIAKAENSTDIVWHLVSPDGKEDYRDEEMETAFTSLELEGIGTERLKIKVIPLSLDGWKIKAEFFGAGGPVFSDEAVITVEGAENRSTEKPTEVIQPEGTDFPTENTEVNSEDAPGPISKEPEEVAEHGQTEVPEVLLVELKKSPTNENVELGGNAIFIARADNAKQIIWHIISPDDTVDYEAEQALTAFDGIKIEGFGTEKIKIINIPIAMNGWKVQAEFVGDANRVLSDKAAILINDFENLYQAGVQTTTTEQHAQEKAIADNSDNAEISPIPIEVEDTPSESITVISDVQPDTAENVQRDIQVVSLWNDNMDAEGKRPSMTIVELYRNDALYFTAVLNSSNDWMYTFSSLPEGTYKIKEGVIPEYRASYSVSGDTVTIMHTISVTGVQQEYAPSAMQPLASALPQKTENNTTVVDEQILPVQTSGVTETPAPSSAAQEQSQLFTETEEYQADDTTLEEIRKSDSSLSLVILIGILGTAGIVCTIIAICLIRKMK